MGSRIFWKLYAGFALLILVSSLTVWLVVAGRVTTHEKENIRRNLEERARILDAFVALPLSPEGAAEFRERVKRFKDEVNCRITVIDAEGVVLADTEANPDLMEPHGERPEVREAKETRRPASSIRRSRTVGIEFMYLALPVMREGEVRGYIRVSLPLTGVEERLSAVRANILLGAGTAAFVALGLGLLLFRIFTRPLVRMTRVAEAIADGDYGRRLTPAGEDEIAKLGRAIQRMSDQLEERLETLTRERNGLRAILASMLEGVIAVDRDERIVHINEVAARLLGSPVADSVGKRVWELTRIRELSDALVRVLTDAVEHKREVRLTRTFRERVVELQGAPLKGADGSLLGAVLVLHDVTELRRLEAVRREFVANVSHELKTPLTAIRGFIETLLDDGEVTEETRRRFLERARSQTLRISALVSDLIVLSRVESEEEALERTPLDLRAPLRDAERRLSPESLGRTIEFEVDLPRDPVRVLGDAESLRQIVDNLLDNAFKYTTDEGKVCLTLLTEGEDAVIAVEDTGIGIESPHLGRIFERFYRVDKARSRELGGTGLGLAIVKHVVEAHGGEVSVESRPGAGSTFRVVLPLCRTG